MVAQGDMMAQAITAERRARLVRTIRWAVVFLIAYNVVEAIIALLASGEVNSSALFGFGLDSVVEVLSSAAVAWQFSSKDPAVHESREKTALRFIAITFFATAIMVTYESLSSLISGERAGESVVGIVLAAASLVTMPIVSYIQRRAGKELGSKSAVADSRQALLCSLLSAVLLVGLGLNFLFGWWWADPIAALIIAVFAVREGIEAWRGDTCASSELLFEDLTADVDSHGHHHDH